MHARSFSKSGVIGKRSFFSMDPRLAILPVQNLKIACENIRFPPPFAAGDVSRGGTSGTKRHKFHTDDVNQGLYVINLVVMGFQMQIFQILRLS